MRQFLHVMVVHTTRNVTLVSDMGGQWTFPILCVSERARPSLVVLGWLRSRGLSGCVIGQWLGKATPEQSAIDWLVVARVSEEVRIETPTELRWVSVDKLDLSKAVFEYQRWATIRAFAPATGPAMPGPFGHPAWLDRVADWITAASGSETLLLPRDFVCYRCGPYEVVLELRSSMGHWFFKGLAADRATEARITAELARLAPESFVRTVALESRPDGSVWWLMETCPGTLLAESFTIDGARQVSRAYASIQRRVSGLVAADRPEMPVLDLANLPHWVRSMFEGEATAEMREGVAAAVDAACAEVDSVRAPASWVAFDLDPANVLLYGASVRFIDLDDAICGPAPLGMATFLRRCAATLKTEASTVDAAGSLVDAYCQGSAPSLSLSPDEWRAMAFVSCAVEAQLAWRRVETKTRRGEIFNCLDSARAAIQRTLTRAADRFARMTAT